MTKQVKDTNGNPRRTGSERSEKWHARPVEAVFEAMCTDQDGLSAGKAQSLLDQYGPNSLKPPKQRSPFMRFMTQFHNVLIYVLLGAGLMTALLQHWIDAGVIFSVVFINAFIGFLQEGKAEQALAAIRKMLSNEATVIRGGKRMSLDARELVPGDVVLLRSGDKVPADVRLYRTSNCRIDEAVLTGESVPVEKTNETVEPDVALGDRRCMAYSGTLVTSGQAFGVVVETGMATELGRISAMVSETEAITTPLIRQMDTFGHILSVVIVFAAAFTFVFGVWVVGDPAIALGTRLVEMFMAAVALAVAAIPEGLPAIMTIVLAIGVRRMAHRHAIIRRLPAVDTLGALTVICSDKTGTLTRNEMTVTRVVTASGDCDVEGGGYVPEGNILRHGEARTVGNDVELRFLALTGVLCGDSDLRLKDGQWMPEGDPMEAALLAFGMKSGMDVECEEQDWQTHDTIPFDSTIRYMATLNRHAQDGETMICLKGAPERVVEMAAQEMRDGTPMPIDSNKWREKAESLASEGCRVLAAAYKPVASEVQALDPDTVGDGLIFLGLFGIIDPPRQEALEAIKECHTAGIRVVMITGDHALTARTIARQMGISDGQKAMTGVELDELDDAALQEVAADVNVFARVSPEHKLRLVRALQASGEVVAMTGDGVNDAPALKRADVGIAMGIKGTEVSKEASEMVLADDNFASIAHAVTEGRTVYDNLRKSILFILPTNGGEGLTILAAVMLGLQLPMSPVQLLWINMITAVTLALSLAFEPPESNVMTRPPRNPKANLLDAYFAWRIAFVSVSCWLGTFGAFFLTRRAGMDIDVARTVAVNTLVTFEAFYLLNCRYLTNAVWTPRDLFGSKFVISAIVLVMAFQMFFTYTPLMQSLFQTKAISLGQWGMIVAISFSVYVLVEIEKAVVRKVRRA